MVRGGGEDELHSVKPNKQTETGKLTMATQSWAVRQGGGTAGRSRPRATGGCARPRAGAKALVLGGQGHLREQGRGEWGTGGATSRWLDAPLLGTKGAEPMRKGKRASDWSC